MTAAHKFVLYVVVQPFETVLPTSCRVDAYPQALCGIGRMHTTRMQGHKMSRSRGPVTFLCALAVAVCLLLASQRECAVLVGPAGGRALNHAARSGGATGPAPGNLMTGAKLAYEQSHGYFDDIRDEDWLERQQRARLHRHYAHEGVQKVDRDTVPSRWYMRNYFPLFTCPNQHRVGGPGDGPKWVCDPLRLKKKYRRQAASRIEPGAADNKCLVYSVGCHGHYSFEDGLVDLLGAGTCEIHTFDLAGDYTRQGDAENKDIHFHFWGLKSSYDNSGVSSRYTYKSLSETMKELGHVNRTIDLFKIDCEGCEWTTYKDWISDDVDIRQLMIETHGLGNGNPAQFFDDIQEAGFAMFSKEPNILPAAHGRCIEWSFVKLTKNFFLGPVSDRTTSDTH